MKLEKFNSVEEVELFFKQKAPKYQKAMLSILGAISAERTHDVADPYRYSMTVFIQLWNNAVNTYRKVPSLSFAKGSWVLLQVLINELRNIKESEGKLDDNDVWLERNEK